MSSPAVVPAPDAVAELRAAYLEAVLAPAARRAQALVVDAVHAGIAVADVYLRVLAPVQAEIGRRWENGELSVAREHVATQITQAALAQLAARLPTGDRGRGRVAVVSCPAGERHALGGQMVADFLESDGWDVRMLGADVPIGSLAALAEDEGAALVALSVSLREHLLAAGATCASLRRLASPPMIVAGGRAFAGDPGGAEAIGADLHASDPEALLTLLADRLP